MSLKWWIALVLIAVVAVAAAIVVTYGWVGLAVLALCDVLTLLIAGKFTRSEDFAGVIQPNCRRRDLMRQLEDGSVSIVDGRVHPAESRRGTASRWIAIAAVIAAALLVVGAIYLARR